MSSSPLFRAAPAIVVILSGIVAALHIGKMPPAIPVLRDALGITLVEAGFLLSTVQMAGMLMGVVIGVATDGIGLRRSIMAGQITLAAASFAGMWAQSAAGLLVLRAAEGVGVLLVILPSPSLIRQLVSLNRLVLHLGLWGAYMASGTSLALLIGPSVMDALGWHGWWGLLAAVSAGTAAWVLVQVPSDQSRKDTSIVPATSLTSESWWDRLRLTLTSTGPWRVAIAFAMYSSQWLALIGFLPSIYAQAGLGGQMAGLLTAFASAVNVTGNIAAGRLLHRGVMAKHLLYLGFTTMALASYLAFGPVTSDLPLARYLAVLAFSAVGGLIPGTLFSLAVHVAPNDRTVSTTVGWIQQCSSTGQFVGPPIVAWVAAEAGGWNWTWAVTGVASAIGLLLAKGVRFDRPN